MELFIPSLVVILLCALVFLYILPKMAPYTIGILSLVIFALGIWQNYTMFPYEYSGTMLLHTLKNYYPFIMLTAVILGVMIAILFVYGPSPPSISTIIPEIAIPANIVNVAKRNNTTTNTKNQPAFFDLGGNTTNTNATNTSTNVTNTNVAKRNNTKRNNIASTSFKNV